MPRISHEALTFDDVLLLPDYSDLIGTDASLQSRLTNSISLNIPLLSSAMDTVTESRLAIALAQAGGIGIVHKNMSIDDQAREVKAVKKFESGVVRDPITIESTGTIRELLDIKLQHNISGVPVMAQGKLAGIVTSRDVRYETSMDTPVSSIMTPLERLVTVKEGTKPEAVKKLLHENRIEKVLVLDDAGTLCGMITVKDLELAQRYPNACKDQSGQLRVGAAVGVAGDTDLRVKALIEAGVDVVCVDTAHGHSKNVLDRVRWIKDNFPEVQVIGGNIATAAAALALEEAGADAVKVGIGPGSICTTRIVTGVGVPQITAIAQVVEALQDRIPVIADGGIRFSGDIAKAIVAGADAVMVGSLLAGTEEAPGEVELYQGRTYKAYRGMGSMGAMSAQFSSSDRYFQDASAGTEKLVPEGIEGRVPYKGPVNRIIAQLIGGVRSSMGYTGCSDIPTMKTKPKFVKVTSAGMHESHVHDVSITKEAPNYPVQ